MPLGDKDEENMTIFLISFHYPKWQNARANVMANLSNLNKLPNVRVFFVAAENGSVEVLELVALFDLKTGNLQRYKRLVGDFRRCYIVLC